MEIIFINYLVSDDKEGNNPTRINRYTELDMKRSLRYNLRGHALVEHPCLEVRSQKSTLSNMTSTHFLVFVENYKLQLSYFEIYFDIKEGCLKNS